MSSTYADGAQVACGFGTVYEGLEKIGISGNDAVLITGLGPVGLAAGALCRKLGAQKIIGIDISQERLELALKLGLCDDVACLRSRQCRAGARPDGRQRRRARRGMLGQCRSPRYGHSRNAQMGKDGDDRRRRNGQFQSLPDIIHDQKTIYGSWVTSTWLMEELVERLVRWELHPEDIITHRFALERADEAYALMASGRCGKVAVCPGKA